MNKDHLSYSITLTAYAKHKVSCISKLYNEAWGLYEDKPAWLGQQHLVCQFHDQGGHSQICQMSPPAKLESGRPLEFFFDDDEKYFLAGSDIWQILEWP
ncbi:hypothetical protein O0I10_008223 [Lichtheimia ornata]|uniref:Uncharacterized protein n=1 Tax=Lichtheimia ornata TaxID=688661 RepID=A0AAD7XZL1_9FUNG|nr:uncharacterized protein O0I10_008223 [Lichtheimia ornata]KAJ8656002.1 hypothetical protein O0I10_008223 [Lichtheimia ornata]